MTIKPNGLELLRRQPHFRRGFISAGQMLSLARAGKIKAKGLTARFYFVVAFLQAFLDSLAAA